MGVSAIFSTLSGRGGKTALGEVWHWICYI